MSESNKPGVEQAWRTGENYNEWAIVGEYLRLVEKRAFDNLITG
jgi:hypothetical protein